MRKNQEKNKRFSLPRQRPKPGQVVQFVDGVTNVDDFREALEKGEMVKRIGNKQYPLHRCFGLLNLDLNAEDSDHEGEGSAIDDQAEAADHEPGEDEADDVVLPLGRQPAQRLLQHLQIYCRFSISSLL